MEDKHLPGGLKGLKVYKANLIRLSTANISHQPGFDRAVAPICLAQTPTGPGRVSNAISRINITSDSCCWYLKLIFVFFVPQWQPVVPSLRCISPMGPIMTNLYESKEGSLTVRSHSEHELKQLPLMWVAAAQRVSLIEGFNIGTFRRRSGDWVSDGEQRIRNKDQWREIKLYSPIVWLWLKTKNGISCNVYFFYFWDRWADWYEEDPLFPLKYFVQPLQWYFKLLILVPLILIVRLLLSCRFKFPVYHVVLRVGHCDWKPVIKIEQEAGAAGSDIVLQWTWMTQPNPAGVF